MSDYDKIEESILEEKPYNWKKHFMFNLPEMLYFFLKIIILLAVTQVVIASILQATIEVLPEFCAEYNTV